MATTINSGYANSPKLTANIADHADVYGGRALVFDGVTDYLSLSNSIALSGQFTISMWVYLNDNTSINLLGKSGSAVNYMWLDGNGDVGINSGDLSIVFTDSNITTGSWQHILVTRDGSNVPKFYKNGLLVQTLSADAGTLTFDQIGTYQNGNFFFNGKMCDLKIFDTALTEAQVQELYKKPENTPSAVQDNLLAWYPMIESSPESPQSIVYDHSEKKLGSEFVTNGDMGNLADAGSNGYAFIPSSGWGHKHWNNSGGESTQFSQSDNGALRIFSNKEGISYYTVGASVSVSTGVLYKLTFDAKTNDASKTNLGVRYSNGSNMAYGDGGLDVGVTLTTSFQTFTYYFVPNADSNNGRAIHFGRHDGTSVGHTNSVDATIDNVSVKEVLMGNHATTNFFGDELVTNGTFDSNTTGWTGMAGSTLSSESGGQSGNYLKVLTGSHNNPYAQATVTVEAGKQYYFSFYHKDVNSSNNTPRYAVYDISNSAYIQPFVYVSSAISSSSWVQQTNIFTTPSGCTSVLLMLRHLATANDNSYFGFDTVSLKEIGISSSGFETAVNEPVVPQVPLMRYNQKMLFGGSTSATQNDRVQNFGDVCISGDFTISFWYLQSASHGWTLILYYDFNNALYGKSDGVFQLRLDDSTYVDFSYPHELNTLRHFTFTRSNGTIKLYVNGVEQSDTETHSGDFKFNKIGHTSYSLRGLIDDLSMYNCSMSTAQVQELFNDGVALDATTHSKKGNLLAYYRNDGVTTWQDRRGWSYLEFNGSSDEVTLDSELTFTGVFSVSFWVRHNSSGVEYVLGKVGGDQDYFYAHPTHPRWRIANNIISSDSDMAVNVWHHVLAVRDSSDNFIWYLNGSLATVYNGSSYVTTGVTRSGDFDVQYFGRSLNTYGEIELTNVAFFNTNKSSSASTFYNNGLSYDYTTESGITNYYKMDSSSTLLDRVGSANGTVDATLNDGNDGDVQGTPDSITIREGLNTNRDGLGFYFTNPSNNVVRFNGVDEYLDLGVFDKNTWKGSFTISFWMKPADGNPSALSTIIGVKDGEGDDSKMIVRLQTDGKLRTIMQYEGTTKQTSTTSTVYADKESTWKFISFVQDVDTESCFFYVDNNLEASDGANILSGVDVGSIEINKPLFIGGRNDNNIEVDDLFEGLVDEVRIYNRALSLAEHQKNYKHQKGKHKND